MGIIGHDRVPVSLAAPHFINQFIKDTKKLSINMVGMVEKIKGKSTDILSIVQTEEEIRERVKDVFDNIIVERTQKLIIFIDELDRCKPTFAIEMLERIKHYIEDNHTIFVVSVNKEQLVHTISNYYGSGFDATRYLNKFFDENVNLPEMSSYSKRTVECGNTNTEKTYWLTKIADELGMYYHLSLRDKLIYRSSLV
ncbi:P-loop NTPase fold protein [Blautia sp.]|uniref:P-loop NTPase fold protein n=1 Tax=Blautia sp. TaxID=1955243 RepID=UPI003A2CCE01